MHRFLLPVILLFFCVSSFGQNFHYESEYGEYLARSRDSDSPLFYDALLERFNQGDTTLKHYEVPHLLIGCTGEESYEPYTYLPKEMDLMELSRAGESSRALELADYVLDRLTLSQQAFVSKAAAYRDLGKLEESDLEMRKFLAMMRAMAWSGDGMTPETAFFAFGPDDGQNFLTLFLNHTIESTDKGTDQYGNFLDILTVALPDQDGNRELVPVYFNINHAAVSVYGF